MNGRILAELSQAGVVVIQNKEYKNIVMELKGSRKRVLRAIIIELAGMMDADEEI